MLACLFADQRRYLNAFFEQLDLEQAEKVFQSVLSCSGSLILTGVGKSGHIAEKIAATLVSTGTSARFLSPGDALHGDIGCLSERDLLLVFSKSGESKELLELIPFVRKRGSTAIAIISRAHSQLGKLCDEEILLPVAQELCPYNLVPTTSAAIQLIFGDCLAIALMKTKQFSMENLAQNHPAGLLGKKITLHVADVMLQGEKIPFSRSQDLLIHVLPELSAKRCGCLIVVDQGKNLQGIFTDGDLRRSLEKRGALALQVPIGELMTRGAKTTSPDVLLWDALRQMEEDPVRLVTVLPVVNGRLVVGLLRLHDILQVC